MIKYEPGAQYEHSNKPLIAYDDIVSRSILSSNGQESANGQVANVADGYTWDRWICGSAETGVDTTVGQPARMVAAAGNVYILSATASSVDVMNRTTAAISSTALSYKSGFGVYDGTGTVYLTGYNQYMSVIDNATKTETGTLNLGAGTATWVDYDGSGQLYVTRPASSAVTVATTSPLAVSTTVTVGGSPQQVVCDRTGHAYVACKDTSAIQIIDTSTNTVIGSISLPFWCDRLVWCGNSKLYAYRAEQAGTPTAIQIIDTSTNTITGTLEIAENAFDYSLYGTDLWITKKNDKVTRIDTTTDTVVQVYAIDPANWSAISGICADANRIYLDSIYRAKVYYFPVDEGNTPVLTVAQNDTGPVDYIAFAVHNLGDVTSQPVTLQASDDGITWSDIVGIEFEDNRPLLMHMKERTHQHWRLLFPGVTENVQIGILFIGKLLQVQHTIYDGLNVPNLSREEKIIPNRSEGGQFLGQLLSSQAYKSSFSFEHLDPQWYRDRFDPFVVKSQTWPFFIAWRPASYPNDLVFARRTSDIKPTNHGEIGLVSVSLDIEGHA